VVQADAGRGGGFLLMIVVVIVYFWGIGVLPALKEVQFEVLPRYGSIFLARIATLLLSCART